jgi:hypothetical protein
LVKLVALAFTITSIGVAMSPFSPGLVTPNVSARDDTLACRRPGRRRPPSGSS